MSKVGLWLCGLCLACLAAGCGKGDSDASKKTGPDAEKKTVTIWWAQWDPARGLQELGDEFEKETGIKVVVYQIPWSSYQDKVFLNFGSRKTDFDIVVGDSQWIGRGATEGLYVELTDWLPKTVDLSKVHPRAARYLCEYPPGSGKYFAAPCETDAVAFVYRKDWFEDPAEKEAFQKKYTRPLAPPDTWDEFRDVAEFFTRPGQKRYGCQLLTGRGYDELTMGFQEIMWCFGGSWGDDKTYKVDGLVNNDAAVEALQFMKDLLAFMPKGGANADYGKTLEAFKNGSVAMAQIYVAFFPEIVKDPEQAGKFAFFVSPRKGDNRVISLGGQGMSISAKVSPEQQELAKKFIAWFLTTDVQKKWITKDAGFTANTDILASDEFRKAAPYNDVFAKSLDNLRDFWNVPQYNELLAAAQQYVGEALDGAKTPKQALDAIAREHEKILRNAGLLKP